MWFLVARIIFWAVIGSFVTAYIHERTGRDVTMGGLFGLLVGGIGGIFMLAVFWIWLWYGGGCGGGNRYVRVRNSRTRWYNWWNN
ncbi:MAG: hypothetical protein JXB47_06325 [Anaerolineae bacterium]|nr:hypothetical protein [Anaerolineae bacterium]